MNNPNFSFFFADIQSTLQSIIKLIYKLSSIIEQKIYMYKVLVYDFSKIFLFYVTRSIKLGV